MKSYKQKIKLDAAMGKNDDVSVEYTRISRSGICPDTTGVQGYRSFGGLTVQGQKGPGILGAIGGGYYSLQDL